MKKSLIALAALATVGAAQAQSSVTVNGLLDVSVLQTKAAGGVNVNTMNSNQRATQYIGFEGTEDLGGGLRVGFQVRTGFDTDTAGNATGQIGAGARQFGDQNAWLQLSNQYGSLRFGRDVTPMHAHAASFAAFGTGFQNIRGYVNVGSPDVRWNNSVGYISPNFKGLTFQAMVAMNDDTSTYRPYTVSSTATVSGVTGTPGAGVNDSIVAAKSNNQQPYALRLNYVNGPVRLGAVYMEGSAVASTATGALQKKAVVNYAAAYNFGFATVMAQFEEDKSITAATGNNARIIAVTAPIPGTKFTARAQTAKRDTASTTAAEFGGAAKSGEAIGLDYSLSKRTTAYIYSGRTKVTATSTDKDKATAIGMTHTF